MFSFLAPITIIIFKQAIPAAPAPKATILISEKDFFATINAFDAAAAATIAVPC